MSSDLKKIIEQEGLQRISAKVLEEEVYFNSLDLPKKDADLIAFNQRALSDLKNREYRPRELHVQACKTCNFKCTMCSWESWQSNIGMMSMSLFDKILEEAKAYNIGKIVFANAQGEPLLNSKIYEMIEQSVDAGFWTMISTNGSPLNKENVKRLVDTGLHNIQFSFGGYDKESYELVYVGGKWEKITDNLKALWQYMEASDSEASLVINGCYAKELEEIASPNSYFAKTRAYLRSIGIWEPECQLRLQLPHNFGDNIQVNDSDSFGASNTHFEKKTSRPGLCRVLQHATGIYYNGEVTACGCLDPNGDLAIGDVTSQSLREIRNGEAYQRYLNNFIEGEFTDMSICKDCDVPYYDDPNENSGIWENLVKEVFCTTDTFNHARELEQCLDNSIAEVLKKSCEYLPEGMCFDAEAQTALLEKIHEMLPFVETDASSISAKLFAAQHGERFFENALGKPVKTISLAPATKIVLQNLDWFIEHFDEVYVGDNFKKGETHFGVEVLSVEEVLSKSVDAYFLTTNMPDIEAEYLKVFPEQNRMLISELLQPIRWYQFDHIGLPRAQRILKEIESAENPIVVLSSKLLATAEPTFVALESQGFDVFVVSLWDRMENRHRTGYDANCDVSRNVMVTGYEQLHILKNLKKGKFFIYYDFFFNTGWDVQNAVITYGSAASMINLASQPVVMGMYDVIKPVCLNMDQQHHAFALYKTMLDLADAVALTSKSDHIAEYLRNTLLIDTPVISFYRYSFPPEQPLPRLSAADGERHIVGVTSFLGEVFEPNRIETRNSIRSMLRQKIHFHYYSGNEKVFAFRDELPEDEKAYFHIEEPIWDQRALVHDMSKFDAGWLVGDEATIFAKLIFDVKDRYIREIFTLFVPNGVPTSSMTYGAAGLPVFISRQIKVMSEVYPEGCCIPLDMGEVDNLSNVVARLDWDTLHRTMRKQRSNFDIYSQIPRLAEFLNKVVPETRKLVDLK